jgi:hypothetical protein
MYTERRGLSSRVAPVYPAANLPKTFRPPSNRPSATARSTWLANRYTLRIDTNSGRQNNVYPAQSWPRAKRRRRVCGKTSSSPIPGTT